MLLMDRFFMTGWSFEVMMPVRRSSSSWFLYAEVKRVVSVTYTRVVMRDIFLKSLYQFKKAVVMSNAPSVNPMSIGSTIADYRYIPCSVISDPEKE
jgi:hypothetical protein